eukprot:scaffold85837_cov63-Attheya_sp.AAC.4
MSHGDGGTYRPTTNRSTTVDHVFSGWSVWLEPEEKEGLLEEKMKSLQQTCGGTNRGVHSFVSHITLLYNVSTMHNDDNETELVGPRSKESRRLRVEQLLHDSLERFKEKQIDEKVMHQVQRDCHASNKVLQNIVPPVCDDLTASVLTSAVAEQGETSNNDNESILYHVVKPMGIHVMDYPKEADGGKGFDCAIPLVVIRNMPWLQALQDAVRETFPPDERHASKDGGTLAFSDGLSYRVLAVESKMHSEELESRSSDCSS